MTFCPVWIFLKCFASSVPYTYVQGSKRNIETFISHLEVPTVVLAYYVLCNSVRVKLKINYINYCIPYIILPFISVRKIKNPVKLNNNPKIAKAPLVCGRRHLESPLLTHIILVLFH
jgi:hypothetical protein